MNDPGPRTALITGASRGLGLALARHLAGRGWRLLIDARGAGALERARTELAERTEVVAVPGDVTDARHRRALAEAARALGGLDAVVYNAGILGPSPQPALLDYPLDALEEVYRTNVLAPLGVLQAVRGELRPGARIINVTSDAAVEPYPGWGGYGSAKAALEQLSSILAAENPDLRVYQADPGDMRTAMHQAAFPGEDISDRPPPENSAPGLVALLEGDLPGGRYRVAEIPTEGAAQVGAQDGAREGAPGGVRELRVALAVEDFERAASLYGEALGLELVESWDRPDGRGAIFAAGRATVEVLDPGSARSVDLIEAGGPVSGPVRLALRVPDVEAASEALLGAGLEPEGGPVSTPWGDLNRRLRTPEGLQLTLFRPADEKERV